ncbi:MAG: adenosine deaminase [Propionicimonas sp.]|uniref:adenosine deaminase n=1 Tax=Propionicimonas sp. TaxID=1955623 RepID=UPI002B209204|nr:adenosine deaminase [Propionicimonas sp.]MEA4944227.1 adenosine deaminase [Propionicimonas sp.]
MLDPDLLRRVPKVALHDHLDGGLRAATVIDLAREIGHELPTDDPEALADWFFEAADSGSLVRYLETFDQTIAVMQTYDQLRRVAREFVEDQAADGVVYAEARWAPEQHLRGGLTMARAVEAVRDGLREGMAGCAARGQTIIAQQLVTAMRHVEPSSEVAELAVAYRDDSVAGFDIAGAEDGFPPSRFSASFEYLRRNNMEYTIHAGEAFGLPSIWEALQLCGASRLGHGVRIVEDITRGPDGYQLGRLARYVRDRRIPLELCPSSNLQTDAARVPNWDSSVEGKEGLSERSEGQTDAARVPNWDSSVEGKEGLFERSEEQTGIATTIAEHPFGLLAELGFRVTVNCDNRLMSRTTLSREFALLSEAFGYDLAAVRRFTINAAKSAFHPYDKRLALINEVILPGFAAAGVPVTPGW